MARIVSMSLTDGSSLFHRWQPFFVGHLALGIEQPTPPLTDSQIELLDKHVFLIDPPERGGVPEVMGNSTGPFVVCDAIRAWLEEHQPGQPRFYSVNVQSTLPIKGKTRHEGYNVMGSVPELDPMDVEKTAWSGGMYGYSDGRSLMSSRDAPCVVLSEKIAGYHFWRTTHRQGKKFMCSEEFWAFFKSHKFRGFGTDKRCREI